MSEFDEAAQCNYQTPPFKAGDWIMLRLGNEDNRAIWPCVVVGVKADPMGRFAYDVRYPNGSTDTVSEHQWCKIVPLDLMEYERVKYWADEGETTE